jgi:hypothetical protein
VQGTIDDDDVIFHSLFIGSTAPAASSPRGMPQSLDRIQLNLIN